MKNIAIVIDGLTGGGAEKVMLTLAEALLAQNHCVSLLSLSNQRDYELPKGLNFDVLFDDRASKVDRFWRVKQSIALLEDWFTTAQQKIGNFDLVLSNLDKSNNLLSQSSVKNVFYIIHNSVEQELARQKKLGPFAYLYLKLSKKNLDDKNLICVSHGIENEISQNSTIKPASTRTIYNPFDIKQIIKQAEKANNNIPKTPYLIHVGRLAKQKRHDILFEAFSQVDLKYKLVLLCNKPKKAIKLAAKYGIENRLILPGFQSNPYNWIKHAQVLVLSSDYEGLPTVLLEALAVGTKVVSTDCPHGPNEILLNELSEFLVPVQDPLSLASAINKVLNSKVNCADSKILTKIDASSIAQQYLDLAR